MLNYVNDLTKTYDNNKSGFSLIVEQIQAFPFSTKLVKL